MMEWEVDRHLHCHHHLHSAIGTDRFRIISKRCGRKRWQQQGLAGTGPEAAVRPEREGMRSEVERIRLGLSLNRKTMALPHN